MSTFVETEDLKVLIDPGVALAPKRFKLPPHPLEEREMKRQWKEIKKAAKKADVIIVSHYHYDHYNPEEPEIFKGKTVFLKHHEEKINESQKERAKYFLEKLEGIPEEIRWADANEFEEGKTLLKFSQPVFHGANDKLGYVVETLVQEKKEKFIHTSDVEGPPQEDQVEFIIKHKPQTVFLDGPLSYLMFIFGRHAMQNSIQNMLHIIEDAKAKTLVVDHHFMRDPLYEEKLEKVYEVAEKKHCKVTTAAEYAGKKLNMLEANRKELYEKHPVKKKF